MLKLTQTLPQVQEGKVQVLLQWPEGVSPPTESAPSAKHWKHVYNSSLPSPALMLPDGPGVQSQLYVREGEQLVRRNVRLGRRAAGRVEVAGRIAARR